MLSLFLDLVIPVKIVFFHFYFLTYLCICLSHTLFGGSEYWNVLKYVPNMSIFHCQLRMWHIQGGFVGRFLCEHLKN